MNALPDPPLYVETQEAVGLETSFEVGFILDEFTATEVADIEVEAAEDVDFGWESSTAIVPLGVSA